MVGPRQVTGPVGWRQHAASPAPAQRAPEAMAGSMRQLLRPSLEALGPELSLSLAMQCPHQGGRAHQVQPAGTTTPLSVHTLHTSLTPTQTHSLLCYQ